MMITSKIARVHQSILFFLTLVAVVAIGKPLEAEPRAKERIALRKMTFVVKDQDGKPLPGAVVVKRDFDASIELRWPKLLNNEKKTNIKGILVLNHSGPKFLNVLVYKPGYGLTTTHQYDCTTNNPKKPLVVTLVHLARVVGTVVELRDDKPVPVKDIPVSMPLPTQESWQDNIRVRIPRQTATNSSEIGTFSFESVNPGRTMIVIGGKNFKPVVRWIKDLKPGETHNLESIILERLARTTLTGKIDFGATGLTGPDCDLILARSYVSTHGLRKAIQWTVPKLENDGTIKPIELTVGDYTYYLYKKGSQKKHYLLRSGHLTAEADHPTSLFATTPLGLQLAGKVLGPKGKPVSHAKISAQPAWLARWPYDLVAWNELVHNLEAITDRTGAFVIDDIAPGYYSVTVEGNKAGLGRIVYIPEKGAIPSVTLRTIDPVTLAIKITGDAIRFHNRLNVTEARGTDTAPGYDLSDDSKMLGNVSASGIGLLKNVSAGTLIPFLQLYHDPHCNVYQTDRIVIQKGPDAKNKWTLPVVSGVTVKGRIVEISGSPQRPDEPPLTILFVAKQAWFKVILFPDRSFSVPHVPPGDYQIILIDPAAFLAGEYQLIPMAQRLLVEGTQDVLNREISLSPSD